MEIAARFADSPRNSKVRRNKKCVILDCVGSEEEGFRYLVEFGKFSPVRIWVDAEALVI